MLSTVKLKLCQWSLRTWLHGGQIPYVTPQSTMSCLTYEIRKSSATYLNILCDALVAWIKLVQSGGLK